MAASPALANPSSDVRIVWVEGPRPADDRRFGYTENRPDERVTFGPFVSDVFRRPVYFRRSRADFGRRRTVITVLSTERVKTRARVRVRPRCRFVLYYPSSYYSNTSGLLYARKISRRNRVCPVVYIKRTVVLFVFRVTNFARVRLAT